MKIRNFVTYYFSGMDVLSGKATKSKLLFTPFEKGSTLKESNDLRMNQIQKGSTLKADNLLPLGVYPFSEEVGVQESK